MNGPLEMYKLRPIVDDNFTIKLPDCMYKLKNIHHTLSARNYQNVDDTAADQASTFTKNANIIDQHNKNLPDMAALELKQQQILQQLAELKKQLNNIREQLKVADSGDNVTTTTTTAKTTNFEPKSIQNNFKDFPEIVVNADPTNPPFSLELLQKLWQNHVHLVIKSYMHSTVASLKENVMNFVRNLENFTPRTTKLPRVYIRLIWKSVGPHPEVIVSRTPILGEVNLLRYLSRSNLLNNYEQLSNVYEIDNLLDLCYCLIQSETKTERLNQLKLINKSLNKSLWLCNCNEISIADIAAYSAIKQTINENDINVNLIKWMERCIKC